MGRCPLRTFGYDQGGCLRMTSRRGRASMRKEYKEHEEHGYEQIQRPTTGRWDIVLPTVKLSIPQITIHAGAQLFMTKASQVLVLSAAPDGRAL